MIKPYRVSVIVVACHILSACASGSPMIYGSAAREISPDQAFILPGDRTIVSVIEERAANGITQTVYLGTNSGRSGQNYLRVNYYTGANTSKQTDATLSYYPLTDSAAARDIHRDMYGVAMTKSPHYVQNTYGPFGYATNASAAGENCVYAWQQIRSSNSSQSFFKNRGRMDIRLRLCESGASAESLLEAMYNYTINAAITGESWNPFGEPPSPSPQLGRPGSPIYAPAVNPQLGGGPFGAEQVNSARLNEAYRKTVVTNTNVQRTVRPVIKKRTTPAPSSNQGYEPVNSYLYPVAPQPPVATRPIQPTTIYPTAPNTSTVIVPSPHGGMTANSRLPQPTSTTPSGTIMSPVPNIRVPSPTQ